MSATALLSPDALPGYDTAPAKPKRVRKVAPKKAPAVSAAPVVKPSRFKLALTVALGVFIPLMSLAMSKVAGTLAGDGHYALTGFAGAIGVAVLAVSLSHLAWAIRDVTGSGARASWALAVALDASIVMTELVHVAASGAGLGAVCWCVLCAVTGFSMILNCHAFLNHKS